MTIICTILAIATKYMVERMKEMYAWDYASRQGNVNTKGLEIEVHEFDYKAVNEVIYQENGVTIRSIPAIHTVDGSVSFIVTWNGLKFSFSSDTYPNKWWMEYTKDSDLANYFTIGAEYKYPFHPRVGINPMVEYVSGADAWVLVFPVFYRPVGGFKIFAGPGVELEPRRGSSEGGGESGDDESESDGEEESGTDTLFLFRIGVAYSFEFGERYSITPGLELDFINEEDEIAKALVYGMSFGISF